MIWYHRAKGEKECACSLLFPICLAILINFFVNRNLILTVPIAFVLTCGQYYLHFYTGKLRPIWCIEHIDNWRSFLLL